MNGARDFVQHISEITPPETNRALGSLKMVSFWGNLKRPCFRCGVLLLVFREFLGEHPPQVWGHSSLRFTMSKFPCVKLRLSRCRRNVAGEGVGTTCEVQKRLCHSCRCRAGRCHHGILDAGKISEFLSLSHCRSQCKM